MPQSEFSAHTLSKKHKILPSAIGTISFAGKNAPQTDPDWTSTRSRTRTSRGSKLRSFDL